LSSSELALTTIAAATVAGIVCQIAAQRLRIPAIVPLLLVGVAVGPSGLGLVVPSSLGQGLPIIAKLAVAIILFEGALVLRLGDLRDAAREVRNLITIGVLVSWVGATLAARFIAQLTWPIAIVFGALVTVTGPTVVQPLLKGISIPRRVRATLEGEAILIDPIGAVLAVAVVDVVMSIAGVRAIGIGGTAWAYFGRLLVGIVLGVAGGALLSWVLRRQSFVPAELRNLLPLAGVWGVFGLAEALQPESGIMAAVALGLTMQRGAIPEERRLRRFKEQMTVLAISLLFVLLSADLPMDALRAEGWRGLATVATLIFVVRPLDVLLSLRRSSMSWREKAFVAWISPRGIVAASVASVFAIELVEAGFSEGTRLLAITFMVIAVTVTLQGLTASPVARLLGLQSVGGQRAIVVGGGSIGLALARTLQSFGRPTVVIDRNASNVERARAQGLTAVDGNALDDLTLERAGAEGAATLVALTTNAEVNALAAHVAQDAFGIPRALPALSAPERGANERLLHRVGGRMAFGGPVDVRSWEIALDAGDAEIERIRPDPAWTGKRVGDVALPEQILPLARIRGRDVDVVDADQSWGADDELVVLRRHAEG